MDNWTLLTAATAGFIYGVTPGPGVLAVFNIGSERGRQAATLFLAGHLAGDIVWSTLALISVIGVTHISPLVFILIGAISGIYLTWLGWINVRTSRHPGESKRSGICQKPFLHGVFFGFTNPKAYPVAAAMFTALLSLRPIALSWSELPSLIGAAVVGELLAYAILLQVIGFSRVTHFYRRNLGLIGRLSGVLFIGFGLHALMQPLSALCGR